MKLALPMKVILVDQQHGHTRTLVIKDWVKGVLSLCLLGMPLALGAVSYQLALSTNPQAVAKAGAPSLEPRLAEQTAQLADLKAELERQLEALTLRLAMLQARLMRLDALGERIVSIAELDHDEFDFSQSVPLGGPGTMQLAADSGAAFIAAVARLERQLENRQQQLETLENLMTTRQVQSEQLVAGYPLTAGWITSGFGQRPDPFTGHMSFHPGIDFTTGKAGADISTVASGVVTSAGPRSEYGLMVEVNHGNGLMTRYAHAEKLLVETGDIVKKGQTIALVGSTGRSSGPHLHFEVYKNGRVVDPATYIHRTAR